MESIKKIISGGHKNTDETTRTGEGSHLGQSNEYTTANNGLGNTTTGAGVGNSSGYTGEGTHLGQSTQPSAGLSGNNTTTSSGIGGSHTGHSTGYTSGLTGNNAFQGETGSHTVGGTRGPHKVELANLLDPNIPHDNETGSAQYGSSTGYGIGNTSTTTSGPHDSNLLNKADPRVDSDRDGSHRATGVGAGSSTGISGITQGSGTSHTVGHNNTTAGFGAAGLGGATAAHGVGNSGTRNTTAGPHDSNLANKADPRVDSDRDGSLNKTTHSANTSHTTTDHSKHSVTSGNKSANPTGRDLGLVAAAGSTPVAAHEQNKHTGATEPHKRGLLEKIKDKIHPHDKSSEQSHSYDDNATHREKGATPLVAKPVGSDVGDSLHGVERNRGPRAGDAGHHAGGEHASHVGHGHTSGDERVHGSQGTGAFVTSGVDGTNPPPTHHISGDKETHVGHGHTGTSTRSDKPGIMHMEHQTPAHPGAFDEARRGTTSGIHTDPTIHHVPEVGNHHA